MELKQEHSKRV